MSERFELFSHQSVRLRLSPGLPSQHATLPMCLECILGFLLYSVLFHRQQKRPKVPPLILGTDVEGGRNPRPVIGRRSPFW